MVTTSDGIWTPDSGDQYALTTDLAATGASIQTALNNRAGHSGTTASRNNFTSQGKNGVTWWDSSAKALYVLHGGSWQRVAPENDSGWVNITELGSDASAGSPAPAYRRIGDVVWLRGVVERNKDITSGWKALRLPASIVPTGSMILALPGSTGSSTMRVFISTGDPGLVSVTAPRSGSSRYIAFDGVSYPLG